MLDVKKLKIKLNQEIILHDVTFHAEDGEILGIIGLNGAGKSVLVHAIAGRQPVDDGIIELDGKRIDENDSKKTRQMGIACLYQNVNLCEDLTVAENILLGSMPKKKSGRLDWKKMFNTANEAMEYVGLPISGNSKISELNYEQQRMVELAKAVYRKARLIILDEPIWKGVNGDGNVFEKLLPKLKARGITVLIVTHHLNNAVKYCDSLIIVKNGTTSEKIRRENISSEELYKKVGSINYSWIYPKIICKRGNEIFRVEELSTADGISNVGFKLYDHEILGIYGDSFSGKSSLARALAGAEKIISGRIFLLGAELFMHRPSDAVRAGIGFMTQDSGESDIFSNMSIPENITISNLQGVYGPLSGVDKKNHEVAEEMKDSLYINIEDFDQPVYQLSGGNQQKVRLARRLFANSHLLILENPTNGIDIVGKSDVYNYICNFILNHRAIILVSADLGELKGLCDRILYMKDGKVIEEITRSHFSSWSGYIPER
jgi:ribose transport system ATP-binding protein